MFEISASGLKKRIIKANNIAINSFFDFDKSIVPHGGTEASMFISKNKKGFARVKIYQDLNNDGIIARKEMIYKGKCTDPSSGDELLNFIGDVKLIKTMHNCEWVSAKHPDEPITCTREFIPTLYKLMLVNESHDQFMFEEMGAYAPPDIF